MNRGAIDRLGVGPSKNPAPKNPRAALAVPIPTPNHSGLHALARSKSPRKLSWSPDSLASIFAQAENLAAQLPGSPSARYPLSIPGRNGSDSIPATRWQSGRANLRAFRRAAAGFAVLRSIHWRYAQISPVKLRQNRRHGHEYDNGTVLCDA